MGEGQNERWVLKGEGDLRGSSPPLVQAPIWG